MESEGIIHKDGCRPVLQATARMALPWQDSPRIAMVFIPCVNEPGDTLAILGKPLADRGVKGMAGVSRIKKLPGDRMRAANWRGGSSGQIP